jgi:hypothetical protein
MSYQVWIAQRFLMNERGHYTVSGTCGPERLLVELDTSITAGEADAEHQLPKIRSHIQTAARQKWDAGEAYPVYHHHSGRIKHQLIALTAEDLLALESLPVG